MIHSLWVVFLAVAVDAPSPDSPDSTGTQAALAEMVNKAMSAQCDSVVKAKGLATALERAALRLAGGCDHAVKGLEDVPLSPRTLSRSLEKAVPPEHIYWYVDTYGTDSQAALLAAAIAAHRELVVDQKAGALTDAWRAAVVLLIALERLSPEKLEAQMVAAGFSGVTVQHGIFFLGTLRQIRQWLNDQIAALERKSPGVALSFEIARARATEAYSALGKASDFLLSLRQLEDAAFGDGAAKGWKKCEEPLMKTWSKLVGQLEGVTPESLPVVWEQPFAGRYLALLGRCLGTAAAPTSVGAGFLHALIRTSADSRRIDGPFSAGVAGLQGEAARLKHAGKTLPIPANLSISFPWPAPLDVADQVRTSPLRTADRAPKQSPIKKTKKTIEDGQSYIEVTLNSKKVREPSFECATSQEVDSYSPAGSPRFTKRCTLSGKWGKETLEPLVVPEVWAQGLKRGRYMSYLPVGKCPGGLCAFPLGISRDPGRKKIVSTMGYAPEVKRRKGRRKR